MKKIIRKRYDLPAVSAAEETVRDEFVLDKATLRVLGMLLVSDREELPFYRGTIEITLSGEEVLPDRYHAKLLQSGLGVPPKDRYLPMQVPIGNGVLKFAYTDNLHPVQAFFTHTVSLYVECEIDFDSNEV